MLHTLLSNPIPTNAQNHDAQIIINNSSQSNAVSLTTADRSKEPLENHLPARKFQKLWRVCLVGAVFLAEIYGVAALVLELGIVRNNPFADVDVPTSANGHSPEMHEAAAGMDPMWGISDTSIFTELNDEQFLVLVTFLVWTTVVMTGMGLEIFVWIQLVQSWNGDADHKNAQNEYWWRIAQFLFPILLMTSIGLASTRNFLALPVLTVGLWKFGFPETINHIYLAMYNTNAGYMERLSDFLNGVGSLAHHSAGALILVGILVGLSPLTRDMMLPALILTTQHWFALLFYGNIWLYSFFTLAWEFFFEWVLLSNLESIRLSHWLLGLAACVILFAHWLYLIAGASFLMSGVSGEANVHVKAISHFQERSVKKKGTGTPETASEIGEESDSEFDDITV